MKAFQRDKKFVRVGKPGSNTERLVTLKALFFFRFWIERKLEMQFVSSARRIRQPSPNRVMKLKLYVAIAFGGHGF
jgi:hypothetical protein